jgi:hypothetical protein
MGLEGAANLLRQAAKRLDLNPDTIVPSEAMIRQKVMAQEAAEAAALQAEQANGQAQAGGTPPKPDQRQLMDGTPPTNFF